MSTDINVRKIGTNVLSEPLLSREAGADGIFIGALVGIQNGKIVLADNTAGIMAVGVCVKGDFPEANGGWVDNPTGHKRVNKAHMTLEQIAVIESPTEIHGIKRGQGKLGQNVYLGDGGKFTLSKGTSKQVVGVLVDNVNRVAVRIFINGFDVA